MPDSPLMLPAQAANFLRIAPATLAWWRAVNKGPVFLKIGQRRVAYREADLVAFAERDVRDPAAAVKIGRKAAVRDAAP